MSKPGNALVLRNNVIRCCCDAKQQAGTLDRVTGHRYDYLPIVAFWRSILL